MKLTKPGQLVAVLLLCSSCGEFGSDAAQLRITNVGNTPILKLTVLFPEDQVSFGDVPTGATSRYVEVPYVNPSRLQFQVVQLVSVTRDE